MLTRRQLLQSGIVAGSLVTLNRTVPEFLAATAQAAEPGQATVLVVVELTGGNDGLDTIVPYTMERYYEARPTLAVERRELVSVNDEVGLNPRLRPLESLLESDRLAILQGVGYPNPNRSHFESMDIWQTADPSRRSTTGWLARGLPGLEVPSSGIPAFHLGKQDQPLALRGASGGAVSLHPDRPLELQLAREREEDARELVGTRSEETRQRRQMLRELAERPTASGNDLLQFVQRTSSGTFTLIERLRQITGNGFTKPEGEYGYRNGEFQRRREGLQYELNLIAQMIAADLGARIYYVSIGGFDTHSSQRQAQDELLGTLAQSVSTFFSSLDQSGDSDRVLLLTFSEFGRRVQENGSQGTDHGAASCMFAAGGRVQGGVIGRHPSLEPNELPRGDLKYHTDFRQVYATVLDQWLGCDSRRVLGEQFEPVELIRA